MSKKDTYCPYPFIGASIQPRGDVLPCCQFMDTKEFTPDLSIDESRNSTRMQELRTNLLNGIEDKGCQCFKEEAAGMHSMRQSGLEKFGRQPFSDLKIIDITFNNVCNLKCRSCASPYAHLWYDDEKKLYGRTLSPKKYLKNDKHEELTVTDLKEINIKGGEPINSIEVSNFFGRVFKEGNIKDLEIIMSTNGTKMPLENTHNALKQCKKLLLNISLDAYGELNDFMRHGSTWDEIVENLDFYDQLVKDRGNKETTISIHSAISIYNVNLIHELEDFIKTQYPRFSKSQQLVQYPVQLSIQYMPKDYKDAIADLLSEEVKNFMYSSEENYFTHFVNFHNKLNEMRSEDLKGINDMLYDYMKDYISNTDSTDFFISQIKMLTGE